MKRNGLSERRVRPDALLRREHETGEKREKTMGWKRRLQSLEEAKASRCRTGGAAERDYN